MAYQLTGEKKYSFKVAFYLGVGDSTSTRTVSGINIAPNSPAQGESAHGLTVDIVPQFFDMLWGVSDASVAKQQLIAEDDYEWTT